MADKEEESRQGREREGETVMEDVIITPSGDDDAPSRLPSPNLPRAQKKAPGGWRSVKYILGNESFEKLASMGLIANLTVYLRTKYNMEGIVLVNVYNVWSGCTNVTPLVGAFLADAYLGKFYTLLFGSISSFLGMATMTLTAAIPALRPSSCNAGTNCQQPQNWQLTILFVGLGLMAIGAGGIRPCNIAFGADQFDTRTEKGRAQLESFFNWWYLLFTVVLIFVFTVVVYIQSNVSWAIGYVIPTAFLFLSICVFLIGKHTYIIKKAQGSIFVDIAKVIVAACKKRRATLGPNPVDLLYDPPLIESDEQVIKLAHTDMFRFFDKAAVIVDPSELDERGMSKNPWRLCSVQQVEELKLLVGVVPVWFTGIGAFIGMDQMSTFGLLQAIQSNNMIHKFKMPPAWLGLVTMICLSIWIFFYEKIYLPQAKKRSTKDKRLTMKQRFNIGIVIGVLTQVVAGIVEKSRREAALTKGSFISPMSIMMLVPQFAMAGFSEAFTNVALMEYLTTHLPVSMRTVAGAIFFLSLSVASYLNSAIVNIVHKVTGGKGRSPWLGGGDLNTNRLDNFYFLIAGLAVLNLLYFNLFSCRYLARNNDKISESGHEEERLGVAETA